MREKERKREREEKRGRERTLGARFMFEVFRWSSRVSNRGKKKKRNRRRLNASVTVNSVDMCFNFRRGT